MKKMLLMSLLLCSGAQTLSMSSNQVDVVRLVGTCCIVGCETTRAAVRSAHSIRPCGRPLPDEVKKSVTCFNGCTLCAIGCCVMGNPVTAITGCGCSAFGLCADISLYNNTEKQDLGRCHGSFHSTSDFDSIAKK